LQRVLDIFWIVHNFVRSHFTTRKVPAVALDQPSLEVKKVSE